MKLNWLDRKISAPGPFLCLCLSEEEYHRAMAHLNQKSFTRWISTDQADATSHHSISKYGISVVVCLNISEHHNAIEIAGLLVHEAVHAWQAWCDYYGETTPGHEQEAYAIQAISQELMAEFKRRIKIDERKTKP